MSAPLMAMVLLNEPLQFNEVDVNEVIASFPASASASAKAKLRGIKKEGTQLQILFDDMKFSVVADPTPMALRDFSKEFEKSSGRALEPIIAQHSAKLIITCPNAGKNFGEAVMSAVVVHALAAKFGALGNPLGGYWVSSERLCDWSDFLEYAGAVMPAFSNDPETEFPTRYWVSVQIQQRGASFGGNTNGLRPFTGYDFDLKPIVWRMEEVAARILGAVEYIFLNGAVFKGGDTLGVTENEHFLLRHEADARRICLELVN